MTAPHTPLARRAFAGAAMTAVLVAGVLTSTAGKNAPAQDAFALPEATAEPTGPAGPTGPGPGNGTGGGSQFQPPGMPQGGPGYSGGNYPNPPQGNGIDINNPSAQPDPTGAQPPSQQQSSPQRQQPVHGTQPPNYDTPPQQAPQQQAPPQTQAPDQQQEPAPQQQTEQQPDNNQNTQRVNQRRQECQDAAAMLGNTLIGVSSGGGRGPIWMDPPLDPAPSPTPTCPQCDPQTAQKQPPGEHPVTRDEVQQMIEENGKCDVAQWMGGIMGFGGSMLAVIGGAFSAPTGVGLVVFAGGALGAAGSAVVVADCIRKAS